MIRRLRRLRHRRALRRLERYRSDIASIGIELIIDTTSFETGIVASAIAMRELDSISRYHQRLRRERDLGVAAVSTMTREWRRDLWPDPARDPITEEDARRQLRQQLAAEAYWGTPLSGRTMFGGIGGA
ncbi:hypothetical protein [Nocardioides sp. L-11A]|uniref:hypothetical protein n=1 Tax=Nocardioides sp. L-11A TaxID=3043848 RepID=UPI00249A47D9|nr:hypothetical protein QJ852_09905 [Nocardioides sp. L-11A]